MDAWPSFPDSRLLPAEDDGLNRRVAMSPEGIYTGARNGLTFQGKQNICQSPVTLIALHFFVVSLLDHSSLLSPHVCTKLGFQWLMDKKQLLNKRPCGWEI